MTTKTTRNFGSPLPSGWTHLDRGLQDEHWAKFINKFGFRAGIKPESWPAIAEPTPSVTFDLAIDALPTRASAGPCSTQSTQKRSGAFSPSFLATRCS
jgi:hypothetical protein